MEDVIPVILSWLERARDKMKIECYLQIILRSGVEHLKWLKKTMRECLLRIILSSARENLDGRRVTECQLQTILRDKPNSDDDDMGRVIDV